MDLQLVSWCAGMPVPVIGVTVLISCEVGV